MELFIEGIKVGNFNTLNECFQKFDSSKVNDWIIIKNGYIMDKNS
jgi:hypothetical protein